MKKYNNRKSFRINDRCNNDNNNNNMIIIIIMIILLLLSFYLLSIIGVSTIEAVY